MKKFFTLAALAIAISASAATKDKYPTTDQFPYPIIEDELLELQEKLNLQALPSWPTEPVACQLGN